MSGTEHLVRFHGGGDAFTYAAGIGVEQAAAAQSLTMDRVTKTAASAVQLDGVEATIQGIVERVGIKTPPL